MTGGAPAAGHDVVVVGGGGSGLAAAIEAARAGARVLVLEKNPYLRGTTGMAIGSITASGTDLQRRKGIVDSVDEHDADLRFLNDQYGAMDNPELRRILVENIPETVRWLEALGVVFFGPVQEPPHKKPRMHNVLPNSRAYIRYCARECRRLGVEFRLGAPAVSLLKVGDRVTGVKARLDGAERDFTARRAVVLTTGDYQAKGALRDRLSPVPPAISGVNPANEGDGQRMGLEAGGELIHGDKIFDLLLRLLPKRRWNPLMALPAFRPLALFMRALLERLPGKLIRPLVMRFVTTFINPDRGLFREGAILVNRAGRRFTEEMGRPVFDVPQQPGGQAFIVMDGAVMRKFQAWPHFVSTAPGVAYAFLPDYKRVRKDVYYEAPSLDDLARKIGIGPAALRATIETYNRDLAAGRLKDRAADIKPIGAPPFCALGPVETRLLITDGGLRVNARHQVLRKDGSIIPELYAAGSAGQGGVLLGGHGHHIGWAFTSGRRAGHFAATMSDG